MKAFLLLLTLSIIAGGVIAGENWHRKHKQKHLERLTSELQLNDSQKIQVESILKEQLQKGMELRESIRKQVEPQMQALHSETRDLLQTVLDEKQLQKFDQLSAERHEKMRRRFHQGSTE